jgi:hypothetical protein
MRLLFGLACATPAVLIAWHGRRRTGHAGRWVGALLLCAMGAMGDPLDLALQRVDGVILQRFCTN